MITFQDIKAQAWDYIYGLKRRQELHVWLRASLNDPDLIPPRTDAFNLGTAIRLRMDEHARLVGYSEGKLRSDIIQLLESEYHNFEPPYQP